MNEYTLASFVVGFLVGAIAEYRYYGKTASAVTSIDNTVKADIATLKADVADIKTKVTTAASTVAGAVKSI